MPLSFNELIEIGNDAVDFRTLYDYFGYGYTRSEGSTQCKCPFHGRDNHPSARIYEDTNSWFCFTCGFSKTPIYFYKDLLEKPLTDAVFDYFTRFREEIIGYDPDLAHEDFSEKAIKQAYWSHLGQQAAGEPLLSTSFPTMVPQPQAGVLSPHYSKAVLGSIDIFTFYNETRRTWERHYKAPSFFSLYMEFTSHLQRISAPTATAEDCASFNNFLLSLESRLSNF